MQDDLTFEILKTILGLKGPAAALAYLNQGVPHRYTAIFRLDGGYLRSVHVHDKLGVVEPHFLAEVAIADSFCQFVMRDGVFRTDDSACDARLAGHSAQGKLLSYHGVALTMDGGDVWGSMCHFDAGNAVLSDQMFALLQQAAPLMLQHLLAAAARSRLS